MRRAASIRPAMRMKRNLKNSPPPMIPEKSSPPNDPSWEQRREDWRRVEWAMATQLMSRASELNRSGRAGDAAVAFRVASGASDLARRALGMEHASIRVVVERYAELHNLDAAQLEGTVRELALLAAPNP